VEPGGEPPVRVAADFLNAQFGLQLQPHESGLIDRLLRTTVEHILLVAAALLASIIVSIPLGIIAAKHSVAGPMIVGVAEIIQTIPGLALLVFMAPRQNSVGFANVLSNSTVA